MDGVKKWWNKRTGPERLAILATGGLAVWYFWPDSQDKSGGQAPDTVDPNYNATTYSPDEFELMADSLEAAFFGAPFQLWELDTAAGNILRLMYSLDDIEALTVAFGRRGATLLTTGYTLPAAVTMFLDSDQIEETNAVYQARGINFQW